MNKDKLAKNAFEHIIYACKIHGEDFMTIPKNYKRVIISAYIQGGKDMLEELRGDNNEENNK